MSASVYLYDGSFEGMLTAIFEAYAAKNFEVSIYRSDSYQRLTFFETIQIETDPIKADRVWKGMETKISKEFLDDVYTLYLNETEEHANLALRYIRDGFHIGPGVRECLHLSSVKEVVIQCGKVSLEAQRMRGLVRFEKTEDNLYVADIEPDHNILTIIAPHFADRLPNQRFIIRDLKREQAVCSDNGNWLITYLPRDYRFQITDHEFERMWKKYYEALAIQERINPKCQKRCMPKRYWKHLIEHRPEFDEIIPTK